jgi:hypothetical protein
MVGSFLLSAELAIAEPVNEGALRSHVAAP